MAWGGARPGAGRKPRPKLPFAHKDIASIVLATRPTKGGWPGEEARWMELLNAQDERLRFDVLKYLTDRRDGKPAQGVFVEAVPELDLAGLPVPTDI